MKIKGYLQDKQALLTVPGQTTMNSDEKEFEPVKASEGKYGSFYLVEDEAGQLFLVPEKKFKDQMSGIKKLPALTYHGILVEKGYLKN